MQKVIKFLTTLIFLFVIVVFYFSLNKDPSYQTNSLVGKKLVELNLESFDGDYNLSTKDFKKNNFTLINFWASWCSPCRAEHQILMSLSKSKKLKLVGINFKDDPSRKSGRRMCGDVEYDEAFKVAGHITPVPGGVGPMTICMLMKNTLTNFERRMR